MRDATSPAAVYRSEASDDPADDLGFMTQCLERLPAVDVADPRTGRIVLRVIEGELRGVDEAALDGAAAGGSYSI